MNIHISLSRLTLSLWLVITVLQAACLRVSSTDSHGLRSVEPIYNIQHIDDLYNLFTYEENSYPLVSAHRGGPSKGFPENAIETFANIASQMPAIIECDIRMTKDSILVLMHDETIDRTTTGRGKLSQMNYEETQNFNLMDNEGKETNYKIPTLEFALNWGKQRVIYTLDVKRNVPYAKVVDMIRKTNSEAHTIVITYNANQAELVSRLAPDLLISASVKKAEDLGQLASYDIPDNRIVAFVGVTEPDSTLYQQLQNHGVRAILGTMGNLDRRAEKSGHQIYAELIERGAGILSTDRPLEAYKALKFYIEKRKITSPYVR